MTAPWYHEFAEGIDDGEPVYRRCEHCDAVSLPPRSTCPECAQPALTDEPLSETATVVSFTEIYVTIPKFSGETPYTVVVAAFEEGVQLTGQLREQDGDDDTSIQPGDTVRLGIERRGEDDLFVTFTPV